MVKRVKSVCKKESDIYIYIRLKNELVLVFFRIEEIQGDGNENRFERGKEE